MFKKIVEAVLKLGFIGVGWILAFIPTFFVVFIWNIVVPVTFWQKFALICGSLFFGGGLQVGLIILAVMWTTYVLTEF